MGHGSRGQFGFAIFWNDLSGVVTVWIWDATTSTTLIDNQSDGIAAIVNQQDGGMQLQSESGNLTGPADSQSETSGSLDIDNPRHHIIPPCSSGP